MSVFAEPLARVEDALVYLESITLSLGPGERTTKLASARAAIDLIEQRAKELEAERDRYAETIRWFWAKLAPGQTYADLEGETLYGLLERVLAERDAAEQRATDMEKALERAVYTAEHLFQMVPREVWREHGAEWMGQYEGDYHAEKVGEQIASARAALSAREEAE